MITRTLPCLTLFLALTAATVRAQVPSGLEGLPVTEVEVSGETAGITPARDVGIPIGAPVSRRLLRQTTRQLLESGRWADVQLDLLEVPGGVRVIAQLVPRLVATRVDFMGNVLLDDSELRRAVPLREGEAFERAQLPEVERGLGELYAERGYERTAVEILVRDTDDPSRKVLVVRVTENEPTRITEVRFEGDQPPPHEGVRSALRFEVGDVLDRRDVDEGVRRAEARLRERGFLEARLGPLRTPATERGAAVVVPSRIGPRYEVVVRGHAPLERDDVVDVLGLGDERVTRSTVLESMAQRVIELYQRTGFHDARARVQRVRPRRGEGALLVVDVTPGPLMRVVATTYPGARHFAKEFLDEQVASFLEEQLGGESLLDPVDGHTADRLTTTGAARPREVPRPLDVDPREVYYAATYERAVAHLGSLYESEGFLNARVGPAELRRLGPDRAIVSVPVVEGPRSMLHSVDVRGNEQLGARAILEASELGRDMPFSYLTLDQAVTRVRDLYQESGYFYATIDPEVRFSDDRTRAEVVLRVVERFPVVVGDVHIEGLERTQESLVANALPIATGDLYRPSLARRAQDRLLELGVFSGVTVAPRDPTLPERVKDVVVTITERPNQYLDFRFGVSTGEGVRVGFEYGYRNLFGYAIGVSLRVQFANQFFFLIRDEEIRDRFQGLPLEDRLERRVGASLVFPYIGIDNVVTALSVTHQRENERDFGFDKNGVDLTFSWRPRREFNASLSQGFEATDVGLLTSGTVEDLLRMTMDPRLRRLLLVPEGRSRLVATGATLNLDLRDNPFTPTRGFFVSVSAEWGRTLSAGEVDLGTGVEQLFSHHVRSTITGSAYAPLGGKLVFAAQARIGRVFHLSDRSETYPNRQFFMGGVDTMRGYLEDAMVPQDIADEIAQNPDLTVDDVLRGGDAFVLLRGELRFPIVGELHGGVFTDLGNLWARAGQLDPLDLRPTAGLGVRVQTPVGPLAFDYGFLLMRRDVLEERFGAFHFSIGLF